MYHYFISYIISSSFHTVYISTSDITVYFSLKSSAVATVLVRNGILRKGSIILADQAFAKVMTVVMTLKIFF